MTKIVSQVYNVWNLSNHNLLTKTFSLNRPFALRGHGKVPLIFSPAIPADSMLLASARLCARLLPNLYLKVKKTITIK